MAKKYVKKVLDLGNLTSRTEDTVKKRFVNHLGKRYLDYPYLPWKEEVETRSPTAGLELTAARCIPNWP